MFRVSVTGSSLQSNQGMVPGLAPRARDPKCNTLSAAIPCCSTTATTSLAFLAREVAKSDQKETGSAVQMHFP